MSMKPTINTNLNKKKLSQFLVVLSLTLTGCSTASESFDSQATQGVGSKSISQVNAMIDKGQIEGIKGDNESDKVIAPVLVQTPIPTFNQETIVLSDHSVIHRQPEQHMRIWMAPFQDANGNFHEASVIHTLQRPSFWQVNTIH
jgi:conjugal transfer pilus assembly protein TraV